MSTTRAIYAGLRALGLADEDERRDLYYRVTGKNRLRDMSPRDKRAVVEHLRKSGFRPAATRPAAQRLDGPFATKLRALWLSAWNLGLTRRRDDATLIAFVRRQTKIDHPRFVTHPDDAQKVISALKGWMARKGGVNWPQGDGTGRAAQLAVIAAQCRILGISDRVPDDIARPIDALNAFGRSIRAAKGERSG